MRRTFQDLTRRAGVDVVVAMAISGSAGGRQGIGKVSTLWKPHPDDEAMWAKRWPAQTVANSSLRRPAKRSYGGMEGTGDESWRDELE